MFSLYAAVLMSTYPERSSSLLMYQATIAKLSKKFKWPSWVIYDDSFRQAAETNKLDWSKIDASLHAQCFTVTMALSVEGWCSLCLSFEVELSHEIPGGTQQTSILAASW